MTILQAIGRLRQSHNFPVCPEFFEAAMHMANAILKVMQTCYLYPKSDSKNNEVVRDEQLLHIRMSATEGWISIDDALAYLWEKVYIYGSQPPAGAAIDWS